MIAQRMIDLIEVHSDQLAKGLIERLLNSEKMSDMRKVPLPELQQRVYEIYHNLSDWLETKTEADIERWFTAVGTRRAAQGVALSHLVCALLAVKENLWDFLAREAMLDRPLEVYQEIELLRLMDQFFDRAVYYAARGHERGSRALAS
ncbi:MAG: hypothetical protein M1453_13110 [Acidobacteria bacterium]|nr:hypothetical protein [Acidobacteriota bacterium]MCL5288916.1 hypothetical protein [Acidobacteriota bacterium]